MCESVELFQSPNRTGNDLRNEKESHRSAAETHSFVELALNIAGVWVPRGESFEILRWGLERARVDCVHWIGTHRACAGRGTRDVDESVGNSRCVSQPLETEEPQVGGAGLRASQRLDLRTADRFDRSHKTRSVSSAREMRKKLSADSPASFLRVSLSGGSSVPEHQVSGAWPSRRSPTRPTTRSHAHAAHATQSTVGLRARLSEKRVFPRERVSRWNRLRVRIGSLEPRPSDRGTRLHGRCPARTADIYENSCLRMVGDECRARARVCWKAFV